MDPDYEKELLAEKKKKVDNLKISSLVQEFFKLAMTVLSEVASDADMDYSKFEAAVDLVLMMFNKEADVQAFIKTMVNENPIKWIAELCRLQEQYIPNLGMCHMDKGEYGKDSPASLIEHVLTHIKTSHDLS